MWFGVFFGIEIKLLRCLRDLGYIRRVVPVK